MKLYLAGPMRGIENYNFPRFLRVAEKLRKLGHEVFCPAENDIQKGYVDWDGANAVPIRSDIRQIMSDDVNWICHEAEGIVLLPGWEQSYGALAEYNLARALDLEIFLWIGKLYDYKRG